MDRETQWRGRPNTAWRRLLAFLGLSLLLHAPLTPLTALLGLLGWLAPVDDGPEAPPVQGIPVDLVGPEELEPAPDPEESEEPEPEEEPSEEEEDLEPDDLLDEADDEPAPREPEPAPEPVADVKEPGAIRDPVAVLGAAGRVADANAHVRLLLFNERIRSHSLGLRIGELLGHAPQWRTFFGPAGLDPVRDIDQILITGPQLRDSSNVVVLLQHNVRREKIKSAIAELMKRADPPGEWSEGKPGVDVARGRADRADRSFVVAGPRIVAVVPPSAVDGTVQQLTSKTRLPKPSGSEALTAFVRTPANAMRGLFPVPESIRWVRLDVTAEANGGAFARLEAEDESPEAAKRHADELTVAMNALTQRSLGAFGALLGKKVYSIIEPTRFEAKGNKIFATLRATPKQLKTLIEQVASLVEQHARAVEEKAKKEAEAAASATPGSSEAPPPGSAAPVPTVLAPQEPERSSPEPAPNSEPAPRPGDPAPAPPANQEPELSPSERPSPQSG